MFISGCEKQKDKTKSKHKLFLQSTFYKRKLETCSYRLSRQAGTLVKKMRQE